MKGRAALASLCSSNAQYERILTFLLVGVLNQLGIVIGIFVGQAASLALASRRAWRGVGVYNASVAGLQILSSLWMIESPVWLHRKKEQSPILTDDEEHQSNDEGRIAGITFGMAKDPYRASRKPA